jgi:CBS domain-containing protein
VGDVMKPIQVISALKPEDDAFEALRLLGERNVGQAPVVQDGRIVGLVRREDIVRWLTFHAAAPSMAPGT